MAMTFYTSRAVALIVLVAGLSVLTTVNGLDFTLKRYGTAIAANSVININRIGREYRPYYSYYYRYTNEGPLVCHTDNPTCCRAEDDPDENEETGEWYYPDGSVVDSSSGYRRFYVTRGRQQLELHSYSAYRPTGVFCCDIESVNGSGNITAGYISATNYTSINSSSAKCIGIYDYSTLRRCPDLSLSRGWVTYDSPYIPGRVASFTCNYGYTLVGSATRTCTAWGWRGSMPSCQADCGPLPNPNNGMVDTSGGTTIGRRATYSCNEGYRLVGSSTRYCSRYSYRYQPSASWSSSAPICIDHSMVQLKISPTDYCLQWDTSRASRMDLHLRQALQEVVSDFSRTETGNFTIPLSNIDNGFFSCRTSQTETTYRTTISGTETISAVTLAEHIQKWVESGPSLRVQWYVVDVDSSCPVKVSSRYEAECRSDPTLKTCIKYCYKLDKKD